MISNFTAKIKGSFLGLSLLVFILCSCSSENNGVNGSSKTGTHKIVLEMQGNEDVSYTFAFTGASTSGIARMYNKENEYQGSSYAETGKVNGKTEIICSTSENGILIALSLSLDSRIVGTQASYSLKAYINDKLVDELKKTVVFTEDSKMEMISFTTASL